MKYTNLHDLFSDIANAIRDITGESAPIAAVDFPEAISQISGDAVADALRAELRTTKAALESSRSAYDKLELFSNPFERITEAGTDPLGEFEFVTVNDTPNPNATSGYYRLRANVGDVVNMQMDYGASYDLRELTQDYRRLKNNGTYGSITISNGGSRVIFPEVMPNSISPSGKVNQTSIPGFCATAPVAVYLPKHTANNANNSNWLGSSVGANVKEHVVVAPKDMDAPLHLHRMALMSADTIVAILENLADVRDRENPPTLTLGAVNLAKLTEEQIAIAEEKGWNLA